MTAINNLKSKLFALNQASTSHIVFSDMTKISKILDEQKRSINDLFGISKISEDKIVAAIQSFASRHVVRNMPEARLLSYGCTQKMNDGYALIEDEVGFKILISYLVSNKSSKRQFRKCYRGLLNGYFAYNVNLSKASESGKKSWHILKSFLAENSNNLKLVGFNPEWIGILSENLNILSDKPCDKYGLKALYGDRSDFEMLKDKLELSSDSWLFEQFINAQIEAGVGLSDEKFISVISPLLDLLSNNALLQDHGLSKIINRYFKCQDIQIHHQLKDYVIGLWKNPWLNAHSSKWALIDIGAKHKIEEWLKLELITLFFSLLAEDGSNNLRRVNYWKKNHQIITEMYFVVAHNASFRYSSDFKKIKSTMEGRMLDMVGSSTSAFIMRIGNYYFIEFGQIGNATYIYKHNHFPLDLSKVKKTSIYTLKNKEMADNRLAHNEVMHGFTSWEARFDKEIRDRISESKSIPSYAKNTPHRAEVTRDPPAPVITSNLRNRSDDNSSYIRLLSDNRFRVDDLRHKGGSLWLTPRTVITVDDVRELESNGFTWSSKKKGYYRS